MSRSARTTTHSIPLINGYTVMPAIVGSLISCQLVLLRVVLTGSSSFLFMIWNLFLAWVPYLISIYVLHTKRHFLARPIVLLAVATIWLLFYPNAPYILTDLIHLKARVGIPLWFDAAMLGSFAITGVAIGCMSLAQMHILAERLTNRVFGWIMIGGILWLTSFGIYLGRVLRWNSWDILTNPFALFQDIWFRLIAPHHFPRATGGTLLLAVFLFGVYLLYVSLFQKKQLLLT